MSYTHLEAQFSLQEPVERFAILTTVGVVEPLVRAHDVGRSRANGIDEWPGERQ